MTPRIPHHWNPLRTELQDLEALFVGRDEPLDVLARRIIDQAEGPSHQHFVVTGPRGIGKTTLLRMVRRRIERDPEAGPQWAAVTFPEESYGVYGLRAFFALILERLAKEHGDVFGPELVDGVREAEDEREAVEAAVGSLEAAVAEGGRRVVLFLDNLDLFLEMIPEDWQHQRLKSFLETTTSLLLVAASTRLPEELSEHDEPLYGHLAVIPLEPLDEAAQSALAEAYARHVGWRGYLDAPERITPRIRALADLCGGNPRSHLLMLEVVRADPTAPLPVLVERMLDAWTPYFQDLLRRLPPKERHLLDRVLRRGGPRTPKDAAGDLGWSPQEVSVLLGRLRDRGLLRRERLGRRSVYAPAEGLLRLYYEMRHEHPGDRRLPSLIRFLEAWYGPDLPEVERSLRERRREAILHGDPYEADANLKSLLYVAEAQVLASGGEQERPFHAVQELVLEGRYGEAEREIERARERQLSDPWKARYTGLEGTIHEGRGEWKTAEKHYEGAIRQDPDEPIHRMNLARIYERRGRLAAAKDIVEEGIRRHPERDAASPGERAGLGCLLAARGEILVRAGRFEEALEGLHRAVELLESSDDEDRTLRPEHDLGRACRSLGVACVRSGRAEEGIEPLERALETFEADGSLPGQFSEAEIASTLTDLGTAYFGAGHVEKAEEVFHRALAMLEARLEEGDSKARDDLAVTLHDLALARGARGNLEQAVELCRRSLGFARELHGEHPEIHLEKLVTIATNLGSLLQRMGRMDEARRVLEEAYRAARAAGREGGEMSLPHYPTLLNVIGNVLAQDGAPEQAVGFYREALALAEARAERLSPQFGEEVAMTSLNLANALGAMGCADEALFHHEKALERWTTPGAAPRNPDSLARVHNNMANLLHRLGRLEEAEAHYREALRLRRELATVYPERTRELIAGTANNLASLLAKKNGAGEAVQLFEEALGCYRELAGRRPDAHAADLAMAAFNLGLLHREEGSLREAEAALREAAGALEAPFRSRPEALSESYVRVRQALVAVLEERGEEAEASRMRAELDAEIEQATMPPELRPVLELLREGKEPEAFAALADHLETWRPPFGEAKLPRAMGFLVEALRLGRSQFVLDVLDRLEQERFAGLGQEMWPLRTAAELVLTEDEHLLASLSDPERRAVNRVLETAGLQLD